MYVHGFACVSVCMCGSVFLQDFVCVCSAYKPACLCVGILCVCMSVYVRVSMLCIPGVLPGSLLLGLPDCCESANTESREEKRREEKRREEKRREEKKVEEKK